VIDEPLLRLGRWIAGYYLAPIGEVFRTMLPLNAEFKRAIAYRHYQRRSDWRCIWRGCPVRRHARGALRKSKRKSFACWIIWLCARVSAGGDRSKFAKKRPALGHPRLESQS
jgi:primosomal protein N'